MPIKVEEIVLGKQAADSLLDYVKRKNNQHIVLVCDANTHRIAGIDLENRLNQEGFQAECLIIPENEAGDVTADERSLMSCADPYETNNGCHDRSQVRARFMISSLCGVSKRFAFISYPTAPSVDGFTSAGAPIILYGTKTTIQTKAHLRCSLIWIY
ncbi:metabolite-phosphate dehydrogenase [Bacillus subtilis]|nr:metabolite-phosphate dehydrogenase [Bacillus subtilis]